MASATLTVVTELQDKASRGLDSLGSVLGNMTKFVAGATVAGTAAMGAFGVAAIRAGSDAEEMLGKFNVVFANTGDQVTAAMEQFGSAVGRNKYELMGWAATIGDTLKPMGFAEESAATLAAQMVELGTDLASFNNMSMDDALQRLQSTLIGNHANALQFGVIINENTLAAELAAQGWDELTGAALEQAKVQARINLLMAGTTDAQGDAARTSESWANQMRGLQATLSETTAEIGLQLLPVVTPLLARFSEFAQDIAPRVIEGFAGIVAWVSERLPAAIGTLTEIWNTFQTGGLQGLADMLLPHLQAAIEALLAYVQSQLPAWQAQLMEWGAALWRWLVDTVPLMHARWVELRAQLFNWIAGMAAEIAPQVLTWAQAFIEWIVPAATYMLENLPHIINVALDWIEAQAGPIVEKLGEWAKQFLEWIIPLLPMLPPALVAITVAITKFIGTAAGVIIKRLVEWADAFLGWVEDNVLPLIAAELEKILTKIKNWITDTAAPAVKRAAKNIGESLLKGIGDGIDAANQWLRDKVGEVADMLPQWLKDKLGITSPSKVMRDEVGKPMGEGIILGLQQALYDGTRWVQQALGDFMHAVGPGAIQKARDIGAYASDAVTNPLHAIWQHFLGMFGEAPAGENLDNWFTPEASARLAGFAREMQGIRTALSQERIGLDDPGWADGGNPYADRMNKWYKWLEALLEDGEYMSDWLGEFPAHIQGMMRDTGQALSDMIRNPNTGIVDLGGLSYLVNQPALLGGTTNGMATGAGCGMFAGATINIYANDYAGGRAAGAGFHDELRARGLA